MTGSMIGATVDLDAPGKRAGFLKVPHSTHESAYGWIALPIVVIRGGAGPTVLMTGAVHGDEYEGQVALVKLAKALSPEALSGRVILCPALNAPAALAGRRVSPVDGGNLNRLFPGDPAGSPSQMIAHYVEEVLVPRADLVVDLHSGGTSLWYPATLLRGPGADDAEAADLRRLQVAFDLPFAWVFGDSPGRASTGRTLMAAANRKGVPCIMAELGGGGEVDPGILARTERGLRRLLVDRGLLAGDLGPAEGTQELRALGSVFAEDVGVFEPLVTVGAEVAAGEAVGRVHDVLHPLRPGVEVVSPHGGRVMCRRALGRVRPGDAVVQIGVPIG
jgi:predicted deacylase